jgi:hypothetical protein
VGVQVGFDEFLVSIFRWSKPPHHVKVNPLGGVSLLRPSAITKFFTYKERRQVGWKEE